MSSETKYMNSKFEDVFEKRISKTDPDQFKAMKTERKRQQNHMNIKS